VYDRDALAVGQLVRGPAIVEEWTSTVIVSRGWAAITNSSGNLILTAEQGS
jgi:N-methylhydantoinase A